MMMMMMMSNCGVKRTDGGGGEAVCSTVGHKEEPVEVVTLKGLHQVLGSLASILQK